MADGPCRIVSPGIPIENAFADLDSNAERVLRQGLKESHGRLTLDLSFRDKLLKGQFPAEKGIHEFYRHENRV